MNTAPVIPIQKNQKQSSKIKKHGGAKSAKGYKKSIFTKPDTFLLEQMAAKDKQ